MTRVKRTYNLSDRTVRAVRELSEQYGVGTSQDAIVELAVDQLERQLRDAEEGRAWAAAREDPEFRREVAELEGEFRTADAETWPR